MKKEFQFKGKTLAELQAMDTKEFAQIVPSRIRRTLLRGFTEQQLILLDNINNNKKKLRTHCRDMVILPNMIGKTLEVHQGKSFHQILITTEMLGHVLGEFALTRKNAGHSKGKTSKGGGKKR